VSAPVLLTKAPLAESISRSENVDITLDAPSVRTASFAIAVEKGLHGRVRVEKKVLDYLDSHSAAPLSHCERVETPTGFALPPGILRLTDGGKDMEHGGRTVLPDLGASDRGYPSSHLLAATSGKNLPQPECTGEKPAPFLRTPPPSDGAAEWESIALASSAAPGLDMATDELVRTVVSDHKALKPAPPENGPKLTQMPTASVPHATPASNPHARREATRRFGEVVATVSDGSRANPSPSNRSSQTDERVEATQIDREGLAEAEPGKRIANATRNNISQKPAHPEPHISPREHMHSPVLAQGEQHADPCPETAPAVGRTLQGSGGSASCPSASTLALPEVSAKQWSDGLGNQIRLMLHRQSPVVELKLNPPELRSLEVRIALDKDAANIQFIVHNLAAKDMLEGALPRLRTLLHDVGVNLQDVGIRERTSGEQQHNAHSGFAEDRDKEFTEGEGSSGEQAGKGFARPDADTTDRGIDAYA
jgi:hypothetical protein